MRWFAVLVLTVLVTGGLGLGWEQLKPAQAQQYGGSVYCQSAAKYDTNTNGSTTLVASSSGTGGSIYICGYVFSSIAAVNVKLVFGTKVTNPCDTGTTALTPAFQFQANTVGLASIVDTASNFRGLSVPAGNDLCINTSAGNSVQALVYYYQQR